MEYSNGTVISDTSLGYDVSGIMTISNDSTLVQEISVNGNPMTITGKVNEVNGDTSMVIQAGSVYQILKISFKSIKLHETFDNYLLLNNTYFISTFKVELREILI